ncbi:olfactory receptor 6n2-like protein [Chrysochromulina tobinii]|uniref:Olfactory receptor 6n2-like protein n=1 Tax=Chrysochromulina tobinii TaxID=1460289 RepID=A0A0M0JVA6_9EUKA|nr:olfactory receptor 6n2-like protein [Chrysochromulina tobinii]|eukprot:KOO30465.1 olfactory receptor 6n2-like protein [Chrysochromulina sp. CCMP291]
MAEKPSTSDASGSGGGGFIPDDASSFRGVLVTYGWVTLKKDGNKLVSSRLRLDMTTRQLYQRQWERNNRVESGAVGAPLRITITPEDKEVDPSAFAFGGLFPGTLHAHGKLVESHRASYSIGVAGVYLLHVRLRKQAASLPGSPFLLKVHPGPAFAAQTKLPTEIRGEVGGLCSIVMLTGDRIGNRCVKGGAAIVSYCGDMEPKKDKGLVQNVQAEKKPTPPPDASVKGSTGTKGVNPVEVLRVPEGTSQPVVSVIDMQDGSYKLVFNGTRTGLYITTVKIAGLHVVNSPTKVYLSPSPRPDLKRCVLHGDGLKQVAKAELGKFWIEFFDVYGNAIRTFYGKSFTDAQSRKDFEMQVRVRISPVGISVNGQIEPGEIMPYPFEGSWNDELGRFVITYTPHASGQYSLHVYREVAGSSREGLPGSPFPLNVLTNSKDQVVDTNAVVDASGIVSQDYKIQRSVFEDAEKRWGAFTVDAFASSATALTFRFWAKNKTSGAEGMDAFGQRWGASERVWAHPPPELMPDLIKLLMRSDRLSEVIVVAPFRPTTDWYYALVKLCDDSVKLSAGKLLKAFARGAGL